MLFGPNRLNASKIEADIHTYLQQHSWGSDGPEYNVSSARRYDVDGATVEFVEIRGPGLFSGFTKPLARIGVVTSHWANEFDFRGDPAMTITDNSPVPRDKLLEILANSGSLSRTWSVPELNAHYISGLCFGNWIDSADAPY